MSPTGTATPPTRSGAAYDWRLAEPFMLRIAGLPFDTVADLVFPETAAWAEDVLAAEDVAVAARESLSGPLTEAVGGCADETVRRLLVGLRRDVFNLRPVRAGPAVAAAVAALGPDDAATLLRLVDGARRLKELRATGEDVLAAELRARRGALHELAGEPRLRLGLQLSSPSLDRYADRYLGETGKRARRVERSLLEYLLRTACKTSPFSTLTSVCVGTFRPGAGAPLAVRLGGEGLRSAVRLNMAVLDRISAAILAEPLLRADLPVRATGGWQEHEDVVRYLRRSRVAGEDSAAAKVDPLRETLFFLPSGRMLTDVLAEVSGDGTVRVRDLVDRLCGLVERDRADVETYVGHLLRLGLLETPVLKLDIHDPDPFAAYRAGLLALDRPWARTLAGRLAAVASSVERFGTAGLEERRRLLGAVREEVVAAQAGLGVAGASAPATLVYEDTAPRSADAAADTGIWAEALLPDLRRLSAMMPAFDTSVLRRLVTRGYFRIRHGETGRCDDFLTFAHEFHRDFFDNFHQRLMRHRRFPDGGGYTPHDNWFRQPELTAVDDARRAVADGLAQAYRALPGDAEELVLDAGFPGRIADALPDDLGALQPRSYFLQVAGGERPTAVVNRVYSGLTLLFSRFAHLFAEGGEDLAGRLREVLRSACPPGAVFAELTGGYDATNLNLHPAVTEYEIVCPGEVSSRPPGARIGVDDLSVCEDAATDRLILRSKRLGVEVIPVYLGFLLPGALPEVQQVLLNFSYTGMAQLDLWSGTGVPEPEEDVVRLPRVRYGSVVLSRQQWSVRADRVPRRRPDEGGAAWFLEWRRWRREHGVPRRVFLTTPASGEYKPLYVDFDSYLCLTLVDAMVRDNPGVLVMSEMLPGPGQLCVSRDGHGYVTELTVEIDGVRTEAP
ncbi:lantibiotic dehydratase [Actinomadura sp. DC4]|uniref:lantibiotic dehydratase n=1 Tax=Actinomadura sp. DC4 TaxID=3055069 RepID=UPI0025B268F3|nr:lantibiotic dehydratase [Actinomadura sp. DC4]MDN3352021.1 lantibiotic dehydratase [Actinomadura sp. DC4]